ncbi:Phenylalanine--tRNA ligase alpha subunit [Rickettsiales bacterium Ac37b]|nr:Phenylalanine--tRNA ligase alpha subunit [Rickettsiales bacterium Ac37b]
MKETMDLDNIKQSCSMEISTATSIEALEKVRIEYFGKNGSVTLLMKNMGSFSVEERKAIGANLNNLKNHLQTLIEKRKQELLDQLLEAKLQNEKIDITLPARPYSYGKIHPISHTIDEILAIFVSQGFKITLGPDIEDDFHNFTALNIPENHPARQMHDTFYLNHNEEKVRLLRTHTSPVQIRTMLSGAPPFKVVVPGRTYRSDSDMTHTPMFHQIEGLFIDQNIHMGHLKSCLLEFIKRFFENDAIAVRFRPSFFPFTEPSAEVDIAFIRKDNEFKIATFEQVEKGENSWLEILGCGMVNYKVLENVNIDPSKYQGFAFGLGVERMSMLKYGINDLRTFFDSDIRWLRHYGFSLLGV